MSDMRRYLKEVQSGGEWCRIKCIKCGSTIEYRIIDQPSGFREVEDLICPNCKHIISSSRFVEYHDERVVNDRR